MTTTKHVNDKKVTSTTNKKSTTLSEVSIPSIKNTVVKTKIKKEVVVKPESKMDKAVVIVERMFKDYCDGKIQRKDILKVLMDEANLTKAGSSTYFANIKKKILSDEL